MPPPDSSSHVADRRRLGRRLQIVGIVGVAAALLFGGVGWFVVGRAIDSVTATLDPVSRIVVNVSDSIKASEVIFSQTTDVVEAIETATRSTVRTLTSVGDVLGETAELAGGQVADSLDSAVDTLPGLISTARIIDGTMQALSFVGVDYDPEQPLGQALAELQTSLAPIPDQIREQVDLVAIVQDDLEEISNDARALSGELLDTRLQMEDAERVLASAATNAAAAAENVETIRTDLDTYDTLSRLAVIAAALALLTAATTPLLVGRYMRRSR